MTNLTHLLSASGGVPILVTVIVLILFMLILIEESKTIDEDGTWSGERGKGK